ncbi:hypothetical protein [Thiohalorhabdus methylotrophus]|uniref:Uncharacterized protein n=1 Tax=Thiohalorhabdus methylotrophus TaxID=3242694 RepID=A0ABV4TY04_9GAMM
MRWLFGILLLTFSLPSGAYIADSEPLEPRPASQEKPCKALGNLYKHIAQYRDEGRVPLATLLKLGMDTVVGIMVTDVIRTVYRAERIPPETWPSTVMATCRGQDRAGTRQAER